VLDLSAWTAAADEREAVFLQLSDGVFSASTVTVLAAD
jgi:hypothetical protein